MHAILVAALGAVFGCCASISSASAQTVKIGSTGAATAVLQSLADKFSSQAPQVKIEIIPGLGSAGAIAAVAAGAIDLAISSRDLNDREKAQKMLSHPLFETPYLFVSSSSTPLSLTLEQVLGYYSGSVRTYPDGKPVKLVLRPRSDSNTVYISQAIPGMSSAQEKARLRHDLPVAATDQDNMQHLNSIGGAFSGMTLLQLSMEPNNLQRVRLNGTEGTLENMSNGLYPYKVTVYVISREDNNQSKKQFREFMKSPEAISIVHRAGGLYINK